MRYNMNHGYPKRHYDLITEMALRSVDKQEHIKKRAKIEHYRKIPSETLADRILEGKKN